MSPAALIVMVLIAGAVWGGFALLVVTALRKERGRRRGS
ncbi:MAG: MetS family NSS transporter small subunit [Gemmatimonadota bacterium]